MNPHTHRPCVSVAVFNPEGRILLVHKPRKRDAWQLPQGGIEPFDSVYPEHSRGAQGKEGESLEAAAKRELREETGIELRAPLTISQYHYQYDYPPGFIRAKKPRFAGQHLAFVAATVPRETPVKVDQRELDTYRWVHPAELGKYLKRKEYLELVKKVIREYQSTGIPE
jgi:putative (di)nucleoside polyphosphate hydrolase